MGSNYCPIYQPGLPLSAKCVMCSSWIIEQIPFFGMKINFDDGIGVNSLCLGHHVPIQL